MPCFTATIWQRFEVMDAYKRQLKLDLKLELHERVAALLEKSGARTLDDLRSSNGLSQKYRHELAAITQLQSNLDALSKWRAWLPLKRNLGSLDKEQVHRAFTTFKKKGRR
jgi:hypothetical protein